MSQFLDVALQASNAAAEVMKHYYHCIVQVHLKADRTPVTIADVETEKTIKKIILDAFPDHGFFGEETGKENADADYLWLIDPIDGTKSFVREYPFFSSQIALMYRGELIVGVSNGVMFDELAWAEKGQGAFLNGQVIHVSQIDNLADATLSTGNLASAAGGPEWAALGGLIQDVNRIRGYGDFYHYHLLASGKIDMIYESDLNILDIAALTVIVREAGGIVTTADGGPITLETRNLIAANPLLHENVATRLNCGT